MKDLPSNASQYEGVAFGCPVLEESSRRLDPVEGCVEHVHIPDVDFA